MIYLESHKEFNIKPLYHRGEMVYCKVKQFVPGTGEITRLEVGKIKKVEKYLVENDPDKDYEVIYTIQLDIDEKGFSFSGELEIEQSSGLILCLENSEQGEQIKAEKEGNKFGI